MSRSEGYRPVVLLRRVLLVLLALFLGVVVALFIDNRRAPEVEAPTGSLGADPSLADLVLAGQGFDYEVTDGDETLFHIAAERVVTDRENLVTLEGLVISVEREPGKVFRLSAATGRFQSDTQSAIVEGGVVLTGPDGVEIESEKFELLRKGRLVKSRAPVEFSMAGEFRGRARELEAYLKKDRYQLSGNVRIDGADGLELEARRILYEPKARLIQAEGGVKLRQGRDRLDSRRVAVTLSEEGSRPTFVRARWDVSGLLASDDRRGFERRTRFAANELSLAYDESGQPRLAEIAGTRATPARFDQGDDAGLVRRFVTSRIETKFQDGKMRSLATDDDVTMTEFLRFDSDNELSRLCGGSASARFDALGDLTEMNVGGGVDLHRPGLQAIGDRLVARGEETVEIRGEPAEVLTNSGRLVAPTIEYQTASGDVTAGTGVRAILPPEGDFSLAGSSPDSRQNPIQVTSTTASWERTAGEFEFAGEVRAWQGESFLTAERLRGRAGGEMLADGGIKTVLERAEASEAGTEEGGPVEVTAESVRYGEAGDKILYQGSPEARQGARLMSCTDLEVFLAEGKEVERLECRGDAKVDDRIGGRKVTGTDAIYRPASAQVEVSGNPVVLERPDGAVIRGRRVVYDFETTTAQIQSGSTTSPPPEGPDGEAGR